MTTDSAAVARQHASRYIIAGALLGSFVSLAVLPAWFVYAWATAFAAIVFWRVQRVSRSGHGSGRGGRWTVAGVALAGGLAALTLLAGDFGKMVSYGVWVATVGALFTVFVSRFARRRASA